jgi:hypothetical protein
MMNSLDVTAAVNGTCNTHGRNEKFEQNFSRQTGAKELLRGPGVEGRYMKVK